MELIKCPGCGKDIDEKEFFCPYCGCPIEIEEPEEEQDEEVIEQTQQSGFGITSFVLAVVALAFAAIRYSVSELSLLYITTLLGVGQGILCIIAVIFGWIGLLSKNRKSGLAMAGNVIAFLLLFYNFIF